MSKYTNSQLVSYTNISPNKTANRNHSIDRITPHCIVGMWSAKKGCDYFATTGRSCSANYVIGKDGDIGLSVEEKDRSWCSSSSANDNRAITIEIASETQTPYKMTEESINSLINLMVDICKRNGKDKILWFNDKEKSLSYTPKENEIVITLHQWFKNKACPGPYLIGRLAEITDKVNTALKTKEEVQESKIKLKDGEEITLKKDAKYYNGKEIPGWVFKSKLYFRGTNSDGIIFSTQKTGAITGVINESALVVKEEENNIINYKVRITTDALNIRKGPGMEYEVVGVIRDKGIYTIVGESGKWLKLLSGAGWIHSNYTKKL